jgi:hypothetical protein
VPQRLRSFELERVQHQQRQCKVVHPEAVPATIASVIVTEDLSSAPAVCPALKYHPTCQTLANAEQIGVNPNTDMKVPCASAGFQGPFETA